MLRFAERPLEFCADSAYFVSIKLANLSPNRLVLLSTIGFTVAFTGLALPCSKVVSAWATHRTSSDNYDLICFAIVYCGLALAGKSRAALSGSFQAKRWHPAQIAVARWLIEPRPFIVWWIIFITAAQFIVTTSGLEFFFPALLFFFCYSIWNAALASALSENVEEALETLRADYPARQLRSEHWGRPRVTD